MVNETHGVEHERDECGGRNVEKLLLTRSQTTCELKNAAILEEGGEVEGCK